MAKKMAMTVFLAGLTSLFLLGCYQVTSSSPEEDLSSNSQQETSDGSLASSESSSPAPSAIYEGFTLEVVEQVPYYDSLGNLQKLYHFRYSIPERLSSFFVKFDFSGGSSLTVTGVVLLSEAESSSTCHAFFPQNDHKGQTYLSMTNAMP